MSRLLITCDREGGLDRAAVWQGKALIGLYVDRHDAPDMTGAVVGAKVVRVADGGAKAWLDAGLAQHVYLESSKKVSTGDVLCVQIESTRGEGKAWACKLAGHAASCETVGLITPPPRVWQRALRDYAGKGASILVRFAQKEDYALFDAASYKAVTAEHSPRDPVHPDLAERIDALCVPEVEMKGGGSVIIETTRALTAIDVNAGMAKSALDVNLRAAQEIAQQIKLRNISGLIVIDALKIKDRTASAKLIAALTRACESDPAGVRVFGVTKLGLIEMTRTRRGPTLAEVMGGKSE